MIGRRGFLAAALLCALFLAVMSCLAQAHDIYTNWKIPGSTTSCCNDRDCAETEARFERGQSFAKTRGGEWIAIPPRSIIREPNPTGKAHLCEMNGYVFCFLPPEGGA